MNPSLRLTPEDIKIKQENALERFYSGIRCTSTKATLDRMLRYFLMDVCADLLKGDYKQRAQQFVQIARDDQTKVINIVIAYAKKLRERTVLEKTDPYYLNPSYLPNKIKPIKKLLTMNDIGLPWKRIHTFYPEHDNTHQGRGYTREEIKKLLDWLEKNHLIRKWEKGIYDAGLSLRHDFSHPEKPSTLLPGAKILRTVVNEINYMFHKQEWN